MSEIIAGTYQIVKKIGSGGGGNVFLAHHQRLDKEVVLKADKRKMSTQPELFRVEVDVLKHLNHTYIPQVYDFFVENETVYTVMDYIEGESFDKLLNRGEVFSQVQVIQWGRQLLEALSYLHSPIHGNPPHGYMHSDIKPANLILTPLGNICLIDFNIALALGEEMVIGRSKGYASPEHYGLDFSTDKSYTASTGNGATDSSRSSSASAIRRAISVFTSGRESTGGSGAYRSGMSSQYHLIKPDVRSDIYSVGATLYHLLSGRRPAPNAKEVIPLSEKEFSAQLVKIIQKAMEPNPNLRYQSADEMLEAFNKIRENDVRVRRLKQQDRIAFAILSLLCIAGAGLSFVGLKRMETAENWKKLAEYSKNAYQEGDSEAAVDYALQAFPRKNPMIQPPYIAEAQKALADALGVYDLSDGYKVHGIVELPSAPLYMDIAPDGSTFTSVYDGAAAVCDTESCMLLATLPVADSALSEAEYLDADTIIYAGAEGISRYDIEAGVSRWTGQKATGICISADGKRAAGIYKEEGFVSVYDTENGQLIKKVDLGGRHQSVTANDVFANPNDNLLAMNEDGSILGISLSDGSLELYNLKGSGNPAVVLDQNSGFTHFEGGFYKQYFAFSASNGHNSFFQMIDTEKLESIAGFSSESRQSAQVDETGIYLQQDNILEKVEPISGEQTPLVNNSENIRAYALSTSHTMIATEQAFSFYDSHAVEIESCEKQDETDFVRLAGDIALIGSRNTPVIRLMAYENHEEAEVFTYDPSIVHKEARVSADGERVMLFDWKKFRIYDRTGELINETDIPDAEQVYDQQFRRDENGSRLEVVYNNGDCRIYSASDGSLLQMTHNTAPDEELYEEFLVNGLRIESRLHGAPVAYDEATGKQVRVLSEEDYLSYVTSAGENMVAQFVTADGYYYGQLLSRDCEVLAELPYLCDVINHVLIFDYPTGNLRQSHIFDIEQLLQAAQEVPGEGR